MLTATVVLVAIAVVYWWFSKSRELDDTKTTLRAKEASKRSRFVRAASDSQPPSGSPARRRDFGQR